MKRQQSLLEPVYGRAWATKFCRKQKKKKNRNIGFKILIGAIIFTIVLMIVTAIITANTMSSTDEFIQKTDAFIERMEK